VSRAGSKEALVKRLAEGGFPPLGSSGGSSSSSSSSSSGSAEGTLTLACARHPAIAKVIDLEKLGFWEAQAALGSAQPQGGASAAVLAAGYDYLLNLPMWSLTSGAVMKSGRVTAALQAEVKAVASSSSEMVWKAELGQLAEALRQEGSYGT